MKTLIFTLALLPLWIHAQYVPYTNAENLALGNITTCPLLAQSAAQNPALLPYLKFRSIGVSSLSRFGVKELSSISMQYASSLSRSGFAILIDRFGYDLYNRSAIQTAYGLSLHPKFSVGISAAYVAERIVEGNNSPGYLKTGMGTFFKWSDKAKFGLQIEKLSKTIVYKLGSSFTPSPQLKLYSEISTTQFRSPSFHFAIKYQLNAGLNLSYGIHTQAFTNSFGMGLKGRSLQIDLAIKYQHILGYSPSISLTWLIEKK